MELSAMAALLNSPLAVWLLLGLLAGAAVVGVVVWRRSRRNARPEPEESSVAPLVRRFEEEQLARMEADGVPLWKPDPEKLRRMTTPVRD